MTSQLEKLILKGKAESKVLSCYGAQFYSLLVPTGQTIVITQIDWTPFINYPVIDGRHMPINELTLYSQYQLKISDDKNRHFFHFNNSLNVTPIGNPGSYDGNTSVTDWALNHAIIQPGAMITIPCYFPIQQELRIALTRCSILDITTGSGFLNNQSKEPVAPEGVKNLLQVNTMSNPITQLLNYLPGTELNSSLPYPFIGNNSDGYYWGIDFTSFTDKLYPIDSYPYQCKAFTQPQFVIHYTIIKENLTGLID